MTHYVVTDFAGALSYMKCDWNMRDGTAHTNSSVQPGSNIMGLRNLYLALRLPQYIDSTGPPSVHAPLRPPQPVKPPFMTCF